MPQTAASASGSGNVSATVSGRAEMREPGAPGRDLTELEKGLRIRGGGGGLRLNLYGAPGDHEAIRKALLGLFGEAQPVEVHGMESFEGKVVQYTSDLPEGSG